MATKEYRFRVSAVELCLSVQASDEVAARAELALQLKTMVDGVDVEMPEDFPPDGVANAALYAVADEDWMAAQAEIVEETEVEEEETEEEETGTT